MVTSSTLVSDIRRRSPMLPIDRLPESLSNYRRSQLSRRRLWLTNLSVQPIRFCRTHEHSLTHQLSMKSACVMEATTHEQ